MSRIGKKSILIPTGVNVAIVDDVVKVEGPKGKLERHLSPGIKAEVKDNGIFVFPTGKNGMSRLWGLERSLLANIVAGVSQGFEKILEFEGIGFKAEIQGDDLVLSLGFSHPIRIKTPAGIALKVAKNMIYISGINKELVGETAAKIRALKKPEPYKGKGIRYQGEIIRRKAGKKAVASAG
ncbi:MAG: 50S ribosomal protein L6 [Parcubacteria group bacterium]|nr:50S ribosomal protein L6 [Parcubacteria group bacterium]